MCSSDLRAAVRSLFRLLHDDQWQVRAEAAAALGRIDDPRCAGWLIQILGDGDEYVRLCATDALCDVADESHRDLLLRAFKRARPTTRLSLALALAKLRVLAALGELTNAVASADGPTRRQVADALGNYEAGAVTNAIFRLLSDPDADVRETAVRAMERVKLGSKPAP